MLSRVLSLSDSLGYMRDRDIKRNVRDVREGEREKRMCLSVCLFLSLSIQSEQLQVPLYSGSLVSGLLSHFFLLFVSL